jgi:transposase
MMFIGYLYGIRSECQLEREIQINLAYRWFINDSVPHHSTISWNRCNHFKDTPVFQEIFDEVVFLALHGQMLYRLRGLKELQNKQCLQL